MRLHVLTVAAALALPALTVAQKPAAQQLFDRHAEAVGGRAANKAVTSRVESGTADITFAGISGAYTRTVRDGAWKLSIDIPMFGKIERGSDGTTAWADDPQQGARKETGIAACEANRSASPTLLEAGSYQSAEVLDEAMFEGKAAWPVKITSSCGSVTTAFFDKATGIRIGQRVTAPDGSESRIAYDDYKPFGAIKVATKITQGTPNGDLIITLSSVTLDPVPAEAVALPASIKALP